MNPLLSWNPSNSNDGADANRDQSALTNYSWGRVVQSQPLRVQLDIDNEPLEADLTTMDPNLSQGDRVMIQWRGTSVVVIGKSYRAGESPTSETGDPFDYEKIAEVKVDVVRKDLQSAEERLTQAEEEFEAGNEARKDEIKELNETIIPNLRESLKDATEAAGDRLDGLDERANSADNAIGEATQRITEAEELIAPLPGRMDEAEANVNSARDEAAAASAAAVEANNRSMTRLANGNFEAGLDYWQHNNVTLTDTAHSGQAAALIGTDGWLRPGSSFPVVPDQIWELSLYYQYDVTVEFQTVDGDTRTTLSTHHLDGDSSWSDSGALRVTIPADVHMLSFTITGTGTVVDDITLRDVTDVVRLEEAANANRQKAEQAIAEYELLKLAVDGEGGLRERLGTAETVLQDKADESDLPVLQQQLEEAFGTGLSELRADSEADATAKANAAQTAAEEKAGELAKAEASAAQSAAEAAAAQDALEKANAARDAAIESASGDAQEKADAAKEAAETAAAADAKAKADAAQAEAIRQAKEDATAKANAAKDAAEQAAKEYADEQDAQVKAAAATDAQTKADAVRAEAKAALETYAAEGTNLIRNGSFEQGSDYWTAFAGEIIESDDARSGGHVLAVGNDAANHYPRSNWIATEPGRMYLVEYWAKKLVEGDEPQYLRLYYQVHLKDGGITGGYAEGLDGSTYLAYSNEMPEGEWVQLAALIEVTESNATEIRVAPHVYRTTSRFHLDNVRAVDVTESRQALEAANKAQARADEAHEDAGTAQSTADSALTMAGSKSKVTYSTNAPAGTATVGDTHRQQNESGDIIGEWEYTDTGWQKRQVTSDAISNLDVGKLTAGTTEIVEAVINKLWAELGVFGRLEAREGWIGGVNLADGAVTAEKITATREMVTKIMGAEWAYIAEQLVVDGELIANNASIINAAMQTLSVTERADFASVFANEVWSALGVFDRIEAASAIIGGTQLKEGAIGAREVNTENLFSDEAVINKVWADIVRARMLTAEEAFIGGALIKEHEITVDKLTGLEEILTALLRAKKIEAGEIAGNAIDGMTITGAILQTVQAAQRGVKIHNNQFRVWDSRGRETVRLGDGVDNFIAGELYTNAPGEPGIILFPETSRGLPGIWFSENGTSASTHPSIFVDSDWNLNVRAKSGSTGTGAVRFHGSIQAVDSAILTSGGHGVHTDGTVVAHNLEVNRYIYNWGHPTTGSSTNAFINANSGLIARSTSARKYKTDIQQTDVSDDLLDLNLSTWVDKGEQAELKDLSARMGPLTEQDTVRLIELEDTRRKIGVIADEVANIDDRFVTYLDGEIDGLAYDRLAVALFPIVRRQRDRITALEQQSADLEQRLARLEERMP